MKIIKPAHGKHLPTLQVRRFCSDTDYYVIPFRFTDNSPDSVSIQIASASSKPFYINGTEYANNVSASVAKNTDLNLIMAPSDMVKFKTPWDTYLDINLVHFAPFKQLENIGHAKSNIAGDIKVLSDKPIHYLSMAANPGLVGDINALGKLPISGYGNNSVFFIRSCTGITGNADAMFRRFVDLFDFVIYSAPIKFSLDSVSKINPDRWFYIGSGDQEVWGDLAAVRHFNRGDAFYFYAMSSKPTVTFSQNDTFCQGYTIIGIYCLSDQQSVDNVLIAKLKDCQAGGPTGGKLYLTGDCPAPSQAGLDAKATLENTYSWTVHVNS